MASISSMISFFVLLLVTYSYAAPFLPEGTTTGEYEVINATVVVETDSTVVPVTSIHIKSHSKSHFHNSTSSEESDSDEVKGHAFTRSPRTFEDSSYATSTDLNESSTVEDSSSIVMIPKRGIDVDSFTDATETTERNDVEESSSTDLYESSTAEDSSSSIVMIPKRGIDVDSFTDATETTERNDVEESSSIAMNDKRTVEDFLFTTIESNTEFNQRVIRPVQVVEEKIESSTIISSEYQPEMSTDVQPSSSVDSFVKFTGLLRDQPSTTFEYETTSQVEEEVSSTESPVTSETATKILSIIPGTISETKIVINRPTETPVVIQRVDQKQLSQVGNQSIIEATKSDN